MNNKCIDDILVEAFALVREAAARVLKLYPFDVQIIGGIVMHNSKIAEMQTGEGKTLTAVFPAFLNALSGKGVHILTFNDYLARRDAKWMGPVYNFLGLTTGFVQEGMSNAMLEAMASGLPIVTTRCEGLDELIDQNGKIVDSSVLGLTDAIKTLARDPQQRLRMAQAARKRAEAFTWQSAAQKYLELYRFLADKEGNSL